MIQWPEKQQEGWWETMEVRRLKVSFTSCSPLPGNRGSIKCCVLSEGGVFDGTATTSLVSRKWPAICRTSYTNLGNSAPRPASERSLGGPFPFLKGEGRRKHLPAFTVGLGFPFALRHEIHTSPRDLCLAGIQMAPHICTVFCPVSLS